MKTILYIALVALALGGCNSHWFDEPYPDILEAEKVQVAGCSDLGMISESAEAANPWSIAAKQNMIFRVRERAGQMGATHIVWLHKTGTMASAQAYQCP